MSEPRSALAGAAAPDGHLISIADRGPVGQVTLRADLGDPRVAAAVEAAVGVGVPATWRCAFAGPRGAVWMSPDELLLLCPYGEAEEIVAGLEAALAGSHHLAVDVSDARAVLALAGPGVAEVLAKGAPVDLSPAAFPPGAARRTHLGGLAVAFWRHAGEGRENEWEIVCFRSVARHLFDWLVQNSRPDSGIGVLGG